jgi:hypothetical protein
MSYEANLVVGNVNFGNTHQARTSAGHWLIYRVDWDTGGAPGEILRSLDGGKTWAVLYGAPGGSNFCWMGLDHEDRIWVGVEKAGGDRPTLYLFDENHAVSPQFILA